MPERYSPHNPRDVIRKNKEQYEVSSFPADARRELILNYAVPRRNMWAEIADRIEIHSGKSIVDLGTSSAYFLRLLLERGYEGNIIGVEKEANSLSFVETGLKNDFPGSRVWLEEGDAAKLDYDNDSFDQLTALFLVYHMPHPSRLYSEAHRIVKPGGKIILSTRAIDHQRNLWTIGNLIASHFGAQAPESFYYHHNIEATRFALHKSKRFKIIEEVTQESPLYIDPTIEGWNDYKRAISSLVPSIRVKATGDRLSPANVNEYLDSYIKPLIFDPAVEQEGHFIDHVHQTFFVCENIK